MSGVFSRVLVFFNKYPMSRGVATYAVIWPVSNLCQQAITGKENFDFRQALRYCAFGALYVAPTLHYWVKFSGLMWPQMTLKIALTKAFVEQFTYGPFSNVSFFYVMSLLEGKSFGGAANEVKAKFWPTYQVGVCVWPVAQTINFALVPEKNRVIFVGFCSMIWTCFLAYMKQLERKNLETPHLHNSV
ncbi:mpv17-like protein [Periplaneta americana]|uniref:mpv17-like protein n=1 Tax=Periplaneta americana TaxID=6978 RepID=UPI0037E8D8D6